MVSHKNAVPTPNKPVTGVPGNEKQEGKKSEGDDDLPRNGEPVGELGDEEQEGDEAEHHRGDPEFDPEPAVQFWCLGRLTIADQAKGQPVEVVEPMIEGVVTVIIPRGTAQTLVPLACRRNKMAADTSTCF